MKKHLLYYCLLLIFLLSFLTMQTNGQIPVKTYESQWKLVEGHLKKGLPKSALVEVKKIYQLSKKEKQEAQIIKSVIYMIDLQSDNQENFDVTAIRELEQEIETSNEPAKSILTSLLAKKYYSYYQNIRWQIYNRTNTTGFKKEDVSTWTTEDFHAKISALYLLSIRDESKLKKTLLAPFDAIITKGNTRKLRPTLYDLLAQEALVYFSTDEKNIKKPAYAFEIDNPNAFAPAADFAKQKFDTKDTTALEFYALKLYQKLINFHLTDPQPDALIDVDLQRIEYVNQKSVHTDKENLYFNALKSIADKYEKSPGAAQAWYLMAVWFDNRGNQFQIGRDTTFRFEKKKAVDICEKLVRDNPNTEGGINAYNLLNTIRQESLQFSTENVTVPDKPFLALVESKNISKLYIRIIKANDYLNMVPYRGTTPENWNLITSAAAIRNWEQALPETGDYQQHRVEIKIDALPVGEYIVIMGSNPDFKNGKHIIGARQVYVSNISYIQKDKDFFILDRDSGQPLSKANVRVWKTSYDYNLQAIKKQRAGLYISDLNGHFKIKDDDKTDRLKNNLLEITHAGDRLFLQNAGYTYYNQEVEEEVKPAEAVFLFTDRSIYRPGQTVYYKGIAKDGNKILADQNREITVMLRNANNEQVEKDSKKVNAFGSFSGQFILPKGTLNGEFTIQADGKFDVNFSVEEYKRPKFEVSFDTLKTTYKVNDTIKILGNALAYAGNVIAGANVVYRVVRKPRFVYPWLSKRFWAPYPLHLVITKGSVITDQSGKFDISFRAIPDLKISQKLDPVFDYTIYTDVTDTNGETRSGEMTVSAGYKSVVIKANIPKKAQSDNFKILAIRTENMNGASILSEVQVKIVKLVSETRLIKPRYWQDPDVFVLSKPEFIKNFPNDEYSNETEPENWPEQELVFTKTSKLLDNAKFDISQTKFLPGFYKIEISTPDPSGVDVKDTQFIELTDPSSEKLTRPQYLWVSGSSPVEPGEKTKIQIASAADHLFVIGDSNKNSPGTDQFSFFTLNDQKKIFDFTATENDRGGMSLHYAFVKNNRVFQYNDQIEVPWTNKDLTVEYLTFRDKTLPGGQEKWKIKISGFKKEKVAAEMLASMYDASLDQFKMHQWEKPAVWIENPSLKNWSDDQNFSFQNSQIRYVNEGNYKSFEKSYDTFITNEVLLGVTMREARGGSQIMLRGAVSGVSVLASGVKNKDLSYSVAMDDSEVKKDEEIQEEVLTGQSKKSIEEEKSQITKTRTNFNETAFFFPDLTTNKDGDIEFSFTMPEALTRWKFQALAHTKELAFGYSSKEIITQKDLMVQPNPPRFLREGDKIALSTKVVNVSEKEMNGTVTIELFDTETNEPVDVLFKNTLASQNFSLKARESKAFKFPIEVPSHYSNTLTWRITAKSGSVSDGEENVLPVLSSRTLITETLPLHMRGIGKKGFKFEKLINSTNSNTLTNQSLTVEYTSNPVWYAIQALPYLMEYPYDCAEQTWNRYYANSLASYISNSSPRIAQVFKNWKTADTAALQSNLQKNQELKSVLLEETPWVLAAKTESEQKRNVALLFDMARMGNELSSNFEKLQQMQSSNGGFVWFKGGPDDRYMTQYIVTGIGHLRKIGALQKGQEEKINSILQTALPYLDKKIKDDYDQLLKDKGDLKKYTPGSLTTQYLYMRSFFTDRKIPEAAQKAYQYFKERAALNWVSQSKYLQGLTALALHRAGDNVIPKAILKSLKETAIVHEEMGMFWKNNQRGWWWYEAPIERQALLIEAFQEIGNDAGAMNDLKTWLLKNKQTNSWEGTKATAEACYALLLQGTDWTIDASDVQISLGETKVNANDEKQESGTGYFKQIIDTEKVKPAMGNIQVELKSNSASTQPSWGAVYWQYFEEMDKVTFAETPLKLSKKLFVEKNADNGPVLSPVNESDKLHVGDKVVVRIELRVDRDMEYVHMKDLRASALEPVNVLSEYKWQGGLGYYESTKDASTNFFFSRLNKGTYVFEYPLFVTHDGDFSNGITTIQCMYAPEFTAHSEGVRVRVGK